VQDAGNDARANRAPKNLGDSCAEASQTDPLLLDDDKEACIFRLLLLLIVQQEQHGTFSQQRLQQHRAPFL